VIAQQTGPDLASRIPDIDWWAIAPELSLFTAALAVILLRSLVRRSPGVYDASLVITVVGLGVAGVFTARQWVMIEDDGPYQAIAGAIAVDGFSVFVRAVVIIAAALTVLVSARFLPREHLEGAEYLSLLLLCATGMTIMASANDLIVVFLSLEILSIALYVLVGFNRRRLESQEAALKYFVLGAFSSAVFLYGIALVYGGTGTTNLTGMAEFLSTTSILDSGVFLTGLALLLVGFGFKVAAAPFHMWTPDVYQGAPTPITGFMAAATKAAAFAALLRVFVGTFDVYRADWRPIVYVLAVLSLVVGSFGAIVQRDVKRLLAYSSIAHAGYVLIGVQAATAEGTAAALTYLLIYAFMTIGAFTVVMLIARRGDGHTTIDDYRGLSTREPLLGALLTLFLLAQIGVPLTGGFVAKLGVFEAAIDVGQYSLVVVGALATAVSAFAYLRVVLTMYAPSDDAPVPDAPRIRVDLATGLALTAAAIAVIATGIVPDRFLDFAHDATLLLASGS
jgi:NADH-quinone oxidoreductase subunit N